jgi:solute carrier family 35 protein C2
MIGICTAADVALSNISILHLSISLYTTIKASVLVFTYLFGILVGIEVFNIKTLAAVVFISGGISIAVISSATFSILGLIMCTLSAMAGGLRWALLQILLGDLKSNNDDKSLSNKLVGLYLFSPYTLLIIPICFITDGIQFYESSMFSQKNDVLEAFLLSMLGGFIAFTLIMVEMQLVNITSSLTMAVLGQLKEITQISLAMLIFGDKMSFKTIIGIIISLISSYFYRHIKLTELSDSGIFRRYDRLDRFDFNLIITSIL